VLAFVCIEEGTIVKLDLDGNTDWECFFPGLKLRDIAIISPSRFVLLSHVSTSPHGYQPSHTKVAEKQLMVYDREKNSRFSVPILDNVCYVAPTPTGSGVLLSYESTAPPQFWVLDASIDSKIELKLKSTYARTEDEDFDGPSHLGFGRADQLRLAMSVGKSGDVHIWNRESGLPVQRFRAHDVEAERDSPCSTWSPGSSPGLPIIFATGKGDEIKLWKLDFAAAAPGNLQRSLG